MRNAPEVISLDDLGIVRVRGVDAVRFLQGQLSNDVARLSAQHSILAGYHNPQGRTIALLRLAQWEADPAASGPAAPGDILVIVPRELAGVVASRLGKFILRAKVKIADESAAWRIAGLVGVAPVGMAGGGAGTHGSDGAGAGAVGAASTQSTANTHGSDGTGGTDEEAGTRGLSGPRAAADASGLASAGGPALRELPSSASAQTRIDGAVFVCVGDEPPRWLVISPADAPDPVSGYAVGDRQTWLRLDVAAGQPQVYASTSEEFVAQMLNLDVLNAIAFDKGCYTGQEVIARAHYRGRVKRRMQRFVSHDACHLAPGDSGQLADGRAFKVVLATQLADGRCDFLAVAPPVVAPIVDPTPAPIATATVAPTVAAAASDVGVAVPSATTPAIIIADQVSLPYSLPD